MSNFLDFGGAHSISRTSHCTFDLGNLRILNCTFSRVLSFPSVILKFLRGIFHERRHLVEIHLQIMYRFFAGLSADLMRTAWKNFNSSVSTSCVSNLAMVYFYPLFDLVVVDTSSRQSSECSARTLLVVLMTSSSFSPLLPDCVAESSFFSPAASPAHQIHHDFSQHGCSIRACSP